MKKLLFLIQVSAIAILYSTLSYADYDHGRRGGHGHPGRWPHGHYRKHYYPQPPIIYYPPAQIHYYPQPQVHYYPQPQANYYPPQPHRQSYQDPRSTQGLAGGVIGSVFGYQIGNGDPVATGLGAAAGSYLGNGMAGR